LLLDHRNDNVPELWGSLSIVLSNEVEAEHDLFGGHDFVAKLLVDVDKVGGVLGVNQSEVDFMEDHRNVVIEVVVAASMDASHSDSGKHVHGSSAHSWGHQAHEASELRLDGGTLNSAEP